MGHSFISTLSLAIVHFFVCVFCHCPFVYSVFQLLETVAPWHVALSADNSQHGTLCLQGQQRVSLTLMHCGKMDIHVGGVIMYITGIRTCHILLARQITGPAQTEEEEIIEYNSRVEIMGHFVSPMESSYCGRKGGAL